MTQPSSRKRLTGLLVCLALLTGGATVVAGASPTAAAMPALEHIACPPHLAPGSIEVTCGLLAVPENRASPAGRTIKVAVGIVHAPSPQPGLEPIVFVDGGPSFGAISPFALGSYFAGASYIQHRDVILVDTRGTGLSQPRLGCPELDQANTEAAYAGRFVDSMRLELVTAALAACRDRLSAAGIDPAAYNSAESAADLDDIRRALGYDRWNLVAISADGLLGLTYMRLFPDGIRSAIIDSGQSTQMLEPLDYARGNTEVLEHVFAGCAANTACNAAYPDIRTVFFDFVHQLQVQPEIVVIPDFEPQVVRARIDGVWFYTDALFEIFPGNRFEPEHIHDLLSDIWRAAHGELDEVMRERFGTGPAFSDNDSSLAQGKTMSYVCHDNVGFITRRDVKQAELDVPELAPAFQSGEWFLPTNGAGCAVWDVGIADPAQHEPVVSDIPTLVLAGELDGGGGVPAFITRQIPPTLPNSFFYEMPAGAHLQLADFNFASPCARSIAAQFLAAPHREPDSSCIASVPPFDYTPPARTAGDADDVGWHEPRLGQQGGTLQRP